MATIKLRKPTQEEKDKIIKAAKSDNVQTLEELTSRGVDVTGIINKQGSTALHWAAQQGSDNVIVFLLHHKANVNAVNELQWTPLHYAANHGNSGSVVLLVNRGANINMKNEDDKTPLEVAVSAGCSHIVHYFVNTLGMDITKISKILQQYYASELLKEAEKEKEEKHKNFMEKIIINNKKEKLCLYKIVIFGPSRAGKSSLFQVLLGKTPKDDAESTGVYQYQIFKVAVTMAGSNFAPKWHEIELQDEIVRLGSILDRKRNEQPDLPDNDATQQSEPIPLEVENIIYKMSADQAVEEFMKTSTLMVCYDSGGQSEFFDVMPLLATNPTGYIMVLDMRNDLNEKVHSKAKRHGKECSLETNTTKNLMKNALASVQSCSSHLSCENLLVVGTHLDKCVNEAGRIDEQTITKLDNDLHNELVKGTAESLFRECQNYKYMKLKHVHPVANKIGSNIEITEVSDHSLQEIRVAVESMSKNNELQEEIPIKWLLFLYQLQLKVENFPHYISKMEYNEYIEHCQIDKCDVDKMLEYFHKLGFIFYFKKYVKDVVFSPQWVFDRLSDIIFEKYKPEGDDVYIENGEITKKKLRKIFQNEIDKEGKVHELDDQSIEYLLKIFCGQNIMTEFKNDVYFMPALLRSGSSDDPSLQESIKPLCGNRIYERLYVSFKDHYFPRAMFCYLATELTRHEWEIQPSPRYSNILVFQIPHSNQYVGLFDDKTELVVEVYKKRDEDLTKKPHEITELLFNFINECCRQIQIQQNFEFGFTCRKFNDCKLFAGVKLQYPLVAEKHCKKCKTASLTSDELVWLISPKIINIMCGSQSAKGVDNSDGDGDEAVFSDTDGKQYFGAEILEEAKKAICILESPLGDQGTGFIGMISLQGEEKSKVLVTCYHVIIAGLPQSEHDICAGAEDINENIQNLIEKNAMKFKIKVNGDSIELRDMLIQGSGKFSPRKKLDYFIMKMKEDELNKKLEGVEPISLINTEPAQDNDQIIILQHPHGKTLQNSFSYCRTVGGAKAFLVYKAGTDKGSSGSPIFKLVKGKMEVVGLHRKTRERRCRATNCRGGHCINGFNYGSSFETICKSMDSRYSHPSVPGDDEFCKVVKYLK